MSWPVTVVVPHQKSRADFFRNYCLPSIEKADPAEILIRDEEDGACEKRNRGAFWAREKYILFVDDDTVLRRDCLEKMVSRLEENQEAGYAYCNYVGLAWPGVSHAEGASFFMKSRTFDATTLRKWNYIDTTSLIRRSVYPRFDPGIRRLQDWDLWLSLLSRDVVGTHIDEVLFMKFSIDQGISQKVPAAPATCAVAEKHRLSPKETGMFKRGASTLAVFSHPNHEISIYGTILREKPAVVYLTDGGGGERLAGTCRSLAELGIEARCLGHWESSFYEALLRKDLSFWRGVIRELSAMIAETSPDQILTDAVEYYNPVHDMSLPLVQAALKESGRQAAVLAVPLVWQKADGSYAIQRALPRDAGRELELPLTESENAAKRKALQDHYGPLRVQMGFSDEDVERACRAEHLVQPVKFLRNPDPECILRYDRRGEEAVKAGLVKEAITYREHYLPVVHGLWGL